MTHQETPFGLGSKVDETVFLFVLVEKTLQLIDLVMLEKIHGLIEMFFDEKTSITIIIFDRKLTFRVLRFHLIVVEFKRVLSAFMDLFFDVQVGLDDALIVNRLGLSVVVYCAMFEVVSSYRMIGYGFCTFFNIQ